MLYYIYIIIINYFIMNIFNFCLKNLFIQISDYFIFFLYIFMSDIFDCIDTVTFLTLPQAVLGDQLKND